ncbi:MAG TPA: hypothetical protein VEA16_18900 [Vicinamibacterales bacterium]|nr:hypothetical protein [Vicinamibacterales bacterium]
MIWAAVSLLAIVGVIAVVGFFLPVGHVASRTAEFDRPSDAVFALMSDVNNYQSWWQGATVKSEIVESVPPTKLVTRVVGETQFGGTWTIDIVPTPTGSRMTITERGEIYNVIFRTLSRFVFGYTATMDECLRAAQQKLGRPI